MWRSLLPWRRRRRSGTIGEFRSIRLAGRVSAAVFAIFVAVAFLAGAATYQLRVSLLEAFVAFESKPEIVLYNTERALLVASETIHRYSVGTARMEDVQAALVEAHGRIGVISGSNFMEVADALELGALSAMQRQLEYVADTILAAQRAPSLSAYERLLPDLASASRVVRRASGEVVGALRVQNDEVFEEVSAKNEQLLYLLIASAAVFVLLAVLITLQIVSMRNILRFLREVYQLARKSSRKSGAELHKRIAAEHETFELMTACVQSNDLMILADAAGRTKFVNKPASQGPLFAEISNIYLRPGSSPCHYADGILDVPLTADHEVSTRHYKIGDRETWLDWSVAQISFADNATGILAIGRDVTAEKNAEAKISEIQKVETLGLLSGGIVHDLNNILAFIQGTAHLAVEDPKLPDDVKGGMVDIIAASDRGTELAGDLMTVGRGHSAEDVCFWFEVCTKLHSVLGVIPNKAIEVEIVHGDVDVALNMSSSRLQQVLFNLIKNASDALGASGGRIGLSLKEHSDFAAIYVSDTGPGIPADVQGRLFDTFFTTKAKGVGTGLGLSLVQTLVTGAGGRVALEATGPEGTVFRVEIPKLQGAQPPVKQAAATPKATFDEAPEIPSEGVLVVVDDYVDALRIYTKVLGKLGYTIKAFSAAGEAKAYLSEHAQDVLLLLTDVNLGTANGLDLARHVHGTAPDIKIAFMTGNPGFVPDGLPSAHVLIKPIKPSALLSAIRQILAGPQSGDDQAHA